MPPQARQAKQGSERAWLESQPFSQKAPRISPELSWDTQRPRPSSDRMGLEPGLIPPLIDLSLPCHLPGMGFMGEFLTCQILELSLHR